MNSGRRKPGEGQKQWQPYCAYCSIGKVQPADHTHFNFYPRRLCQLLHPFAVHWVEGCSVHQGCRDDGICAICEVEKKTLKEYPSISLRQKIGYPGDDNVAQFQGQSQED